MHAGARYRVRTLGVDDMAYTTGDDAMIRVRRECVGGLKRRMTISSLLTCASSTMAAMHLRSDPDVIGNEEVGGNVREGDDQGVHLA